MNKLEEYRDKQGSRETLFPLGSVIRESLYEFRRGFDAAIALELPVKFAEWMTTEGYRPDHMDKGGTVHLFKYEKASHNYKGTVKELYKYWIENIYKPE